MVLFNVFPCADDQYSYFSKRSLIHQKFPSIEFLVGTSRFRSFRTLSRVMWDGGRSPGAQTTHEQYDYLVISMSTWGPNKCNTYNKRSSTTNGFLCLRRIFLKFTMCAAITVHTVLSPMQSLYRPGRRASDHTKPGVLLSKNFRGSCLGTLVFFAIRTRFCATSRPSIVLIVPASEVCNIRFP